MSASSLGTLTLSLIADTGGFISPLDAAERATMKAMGRMGSEVDAFGNKVDDTYKKIGQTTKQLDSAFDRIAENLRREAALYKDSSRAAVLKYDLENGSLRALSDSQKNYLTKLTRDLAVLDEATGRSQGSFRGLRGVMQSAGYQAQDVAVQIQQGTSAFQIFSQQGSQFASAFGPSGAVVGALIAVAGIVGGVLFKSFMDTQKAVKDLETNVQSLAKEYGQLSTEQKGLVEKGVAAVIADETEKYKEQTKAIKDQAKEVEELKKGKLALTAGNVYAAAGILGANISKVASFGLVDETAAAKGRIDQAKDLAEAEKALTANLAAKAVTLQRIRELQDVTGGLRSVRELNEEVELMGKRGKELYELIAAQKGYTGALMLEFVAINLLKDARKDEASVKERIKALADETLALQLKNAEIHKNVQLQDELAKKLADAKNTRADGSRISTPEDQEEIAKREKAIIKQREKNDLDQKAVTLYEQQDKAAKDRIRTLQREVDLFGVSSKAQQLEYDIKSGLIKVNGGLESQQAKEMLNLTKQLELKEKNLTLDKAAEAVAFAGYDNTKGDLESTRMQYELDRGILKVSGELTKEYYDQLIAQKKIEEAKNNSKKIDDYLKNQRQDIDKAKLITGEEKLRYDIMHDILYVQGDINSAKAQEALANQRVLDTQAKQLELTSAIKEGLTSALIDSALRGEDAFKALAKSVKGTFSTLVLKPSLDIITDDLAKSVSSILGSVGQKDSTGKTVGASGVLGSLGPYGAAAIAVAGGLQSSWNAKMDERTRKFTAEYRQGVQSTNTVLGEANKKSESISSLLGTLSSTSYSSLGVNTQMYRALQNIDSGIQRLAGGIARGISAGGLEQSIKTGVTTSSSAGLGAAAGLIGGPAVAITAIAGKLIGGEVGGFIDGVINSVSKAIYSKKTTVIDTGVKFAGQTLTDILTSGSVEAFAYADVQTKKKVLGFTTSNKVKTKTQDLDEALLNQFGDVFSSAAKALQQAAPAFGRDFEDYVNQLVIDPQKLSLKGLEGDALTKEIESFFSSTLDNWAGVLVGGTDILKDFQKVGEGAFETIVRLASETNVFNKYVDLLNLNFKATGIGAIEASQAVIEAAGGFDQLASSLSSYYANFFTDSERTAAGLEIIGEQLKTIGVDTIPKTREAFRALVEDPTIDLATEAGAKYFSTLINLSDEFAQLVPATKDAKDAIDELISKLKEAASTAFDTLSRSIEAEKSRIQTIVDNATQAKGNLDSALGRERDTITAAHNERIKQLEQQARDEQALNQKMADAAYESQRAIAKAQQEATKDQIKALETSVSGLSKLFDSLNDSINDMAIVTDEVTRARRRAAEFDIETAITNAKAGRGVPTDGRINDALAVLRNNPSQLYASLEEMTYATAVTQNKLRDLASLTEAQKTTEQQTIELLTAQLNAQELAYDSIEKLTVTISKEAEDRIARENEQFDAQMKNLDAIAEDARKQFDKLTGIDTSLLTLNEAQDAFSKALLAADFVNAKAQLDALAAIQDNAKNQLNALQGIETGIMAVEDALRAFATSVDLVLKAQDDSAVRQANATLAAKNDALLEEFKAMRDESYNLQQETRKNTQESADILRRMEEAGLSV